MDPPWQPVAVVDTEAARERKAGDRAAAVYEAIMGLPIRLRAVIVLREFEGFPYRSLALAKAKLRRRLA